MDTELAGVRLAVETMLAAVRLNAPSAATINQVMIGKALATRYAIAAVEHAMEVAGGVGFYRSAGPERWCWGCRWSGFSEGRRLAALAPSGPIV